MGCCKSKLDFTDVAKATGMSDKEIADSFKAFRKEAGATKIKLDKFTKMVESLNTNKSEQQELRGWSPRVRFFRPEIRCQGVSGARYVCRSSHKSPYLYTRRSVLRGLMR